MSDVNIHGQTGEEAASAAQQQIAQIAARVFGVSTLETRNRDCFDFYDVAVWQIKEALEAAYRAGEANGRRSATSAPSPRT